MGKCKFSQKWLEDPKYSWWLRAVTTDTSEASCSVCCKVFKLGTMGIKAVDSHMMSAKHVAFAKARQQQPAITLFCPVASATATASTTSESTSSAQPSIQALCGSMPTLKAEVIWVLKTITSHQSYRSNEGIDSLFRTMFPDSALVQSFSCGKDKTRYVAALFSRV